MNKYIHTHQMIIEAAGWRVSEGRFVEKPGVLLFMDHNGITREARSLMSSLNLCIEQEPHLLIGEFSARLTYLSFPDTPETVDQSNAYNKRILKDFGHISPYNISAPAVLFAGIASETSLEIVSHRGDVARLTTSKTQAMNNPLYRVFWNEEEMATQKEIIQTIEWLKQSYNASVISEEVSNMLNPGLKATSLLNSMNIRDWHWVLWGRLRESANIERDLLEVLELCCDELRKSYPQIIQTAEIYKNNNL